jgi:hypothetical protein
MDLKNYKPDISHEAEAAHTPPGPPRVEPVIPDTLDWGRRRRAEDHADLSMRAGRLNSWHVQRRHALAEISRGGHVDHFRVAREAEAVIAELEADPELRSHVMRSLLVIRDSLRAESAAGETHPNHLAHLAEVEARIEALDVPVVVEKLLPPEAPSRPGVSDGAERPLEIMIKAVLRLVVDLIDEGDRAEFVDWLENILDHPLSEAELRAIDRRAELYRRANERVASDPVLNPPRRQWDA